MGVAVDVSVDRVRTATPALSVRGAAKVFAGHVALDAIDLDIAAGEIRALIGQNGCGKSTFVKLLAGFHSAEPGAEAQAAGVAFPLGDAGAAREAGLRFVHQDLGLVESMSVAENFYLGRTEKSLRLRNFAKERARARAALDDIGYDVDPRALVGDLAESERTAVAVARALDHEGPIPLLVLDEPTASMPAGEVERLFEAVRAVSSRGTAVLFISHHLSEVLDLADEVTVLRDGRVVASERTAESNHDTLIEHMLGRRLMAVDAEIAASTSGDDVDSTAPAVLTVRGLTGTVVDDLDLEVPAGAIVGVAGLTGSGRDEVARLIGGHAPRNGQVTIGARAIPPARPHAAVRAGLCTLPADRGAHAVLPMATLRENLTIGRLSPVSRRGFLSKRAEQADTRDWLAQLHVKPPDPEALIDKLSGGNQQKVMIARWLRLDPAALVLDEPTQGVDVGAKADIHALVEKAAADGMAVIVCSSDSEELASLATEVIVLRAGRIGARLSGDSLTSERIDAEQLRDSTGTPSDHQRRDA